MVRYILKSPLFRNDALVPFLFAEFKRGGNITHYTQQLKNLMHLDPLKGGKLTRIATILSFANFDPDVIKVINSHVFVISSLSLIFALDNKIHI